jgi:diguanylate cyclase (GGDEF)-like protein
LTVSQAPLRVSTARRDLLLLAAITATVFLAALRFDVVAVIAGWAGPAALEKQLDELTLILAFLGPSFALFAFRRWNEVRHAIARYAEAQSALVQSEERLTQILNALPVAVIMRNADMSVAYYNRVATEWFGPVKVGESPQDSIAQQRLYRLGTSEPYPVEALPNVRALRGERVTVDDVEIRRGDKRRILQSLAIPLLDAHGTITQALMVANDITDQQAAAAALRDSAERLAATVAMLKQQTQDKVLLSEMVHMLQSCPTVGEAYEVVSRSVQQFLPETSGVLYILDPSRAALEAAAMWGSISAPAQAYAPDDCWAVRRGQMHVVTDVHTGWLCPHVGGAAPEDGYICVPLTARGEVLGVLHLLGRRCRPSQGTGPSPEAEPELIQAIADNVGLALANLRLWDTLRTQSIRDPLTGLYNRRYMADSLERELRRAARSQHPVGCIMFDIDHFKQFNDTFGHQAGDALLRELGALLRSLARGYDVICRYGGEEFLWILPEASREECLQRAEQLRQAVEQLAVTHHGQGLGRATVSVGVAVFPEDGDLVEALLRAADTALYNAKHAGRNRIEVATAV